MKILRIISFGFPGGGAETGVMEIDKILRKKGNIVKVISSDAHPEEKHFSDYEFKAINPNNPFKIFFHILNISAYLTIRKVLKEYKPDVVHLDTMGEVSPLVLLLFKNTPTLMTIHGPEFFIPSMLIWGLGEENFKNGRIDKKNLNLSGKINYFYFRFVQGTVYKYVLKKVNLFVVNSLYMKNLISTQLKPNLLIYNGIKLLKYNKIKYSHNLLYVGRIEEYKGIQYAIKAMPQVVKKYPDTIFSIVGEGNYMPNLKSLVNSLNLQNNVRFLGWIDHEKIDSYYDKSSIFIMPSIWPEAFGKTGVEAMSKGRPVIASKVGGIPEWLEDSKTGFLVNPKSSNEIAEGVIKLFGDKKLLFTFGEYARARAEFFSVEKYADNLIKVYINLKKSSFLK